jgi:nucleotide-binding universal stress UspA family protein
MYARLLLTHDGSELAEAAVPRTAALAKAAGSQVLVLRISRAAGEDPQSLRLEAWDREIARGGVETPGEARVEAHPPLVDTVTALRAAGVERAGSLVVRGEPGHAIVDAAAGLACDLIAMSTHGLTGVRRAVLGSVADHVIRHSGGIPVLLCRAVPEGDSGDIESILVALDGSDLSETLIPHAQDVALATGARVTLVRVIDSAFKILTMTTPAGFPVPARLTPELADEIVAAQRAAAEEELGTVAAQLTAAGATVETVVVEGDPGEGIVAMADEAGSDLVLLATHGRGGVGRALLGSVTDYVVRHLGSAAALVVPPVR